MVDLVFKGKVIIPQNEDDFLKDFDILLQKHNARFIGDAKVYQFDDCEVISYEETGN